MNNIDNLAYIFLLLTLFCAICTDSSLMGLCAILFSFLVAFKRIFILENEKYKLETYEKMLILYFLVVTISLFASTLFSLSLHGYLKTLIYILFFFSASDFFKKNVKKVLLTLFFVVFLLSFESFVAVWQNIVGVEEISSWQDMSNINPEQILSRAYGTLKPYNPNLLAGYLLCGLSSIVYFILYFVNQKNKFAIGVFSFLFFLNILAIIYSGCRGAYLGFALFFPVLFFFLLTHLKKKYGSLSNIKKRYKNSVLIIFFFFFGSILTNPAILNRFQSIFALRSDSSISFRLNVYESVWRMFLDNPFLGVGIGNQNFREIYGLYMKTGFDALGSYCVFLEMLVESGVFALIFFVLFLFFVLKKSYIIINNTTCVNAKLIALSVILMIFACCGHGLFDTIWFRPQIQFLFWTNIAILKAYQK